MRIENFYIGSYDQNPNGFQTLGSIIGSAGITSLTLNVPFCRVLKLFIHADGKSGADKVRLRLNGNANAEYSYRTSSNNGADALANTQTSILLEPVASAGLSNWELDVSSPGDTFVHQVYGFGCMGGSTGTPPDRADVDGCENGGAIVTSVTIILEGANTFNAGASIRAVGMRS